MGSLGDHDAHTKPMQDDPNPHFSYNDTQPFDSQTFPSSLPGKTTDTYSICVVAHLKLCFLIVIFVRFEISLIERLIFFFFC